MLKKAADDSADPAGTGVPAQVSAERHEADGRSNRGFACRSPSPAGFRACAGLTGQLGQPDEVLGGGQRDHPADPAGTPLAGLAPGPDGLDPTGTLLDGLFGRAD